MTGTKASHNPQNLEQVHLLVKMLFVAQKLSKTEEWCQSPKFFLARRLQKQVHKPENCSGLESQ
jgi:hypothetical protein